MSAHAGTALPRDLRSSQVAPITSARYQIRYQVQAEIHARHPVGNLEQITDATNPCKIPIDLSRLRAADWRPAVRARGRPALRRVGAPVRSLLVLGWPRAREARCAGSCR